MGLALQEGKKAAIFADMTNSVVRLGLEALVAGKVGRDLRSAPVALVLHPASVGPDLKGSADTLLEAGFSVRTLFGPQHGAGGEKQDNMIESEHATDPRTGLPVYSLYSGVRKPTPEMLVGLDAVLFDLQDVGVRVYTFVWTMALAMEACAEAGVRFVVLDRPNPIGGDAVQGPVLQPGFESFVGLHPIPLRHGLTTGELALWLNRVRGIGCDLTVVPMEGWRRSMRWRDTGLPYVPPSPNLPTPDSCTVYPGMVLLEGTNLSEGRGTTRPFEIVGAPFLDEHAFAAELSAMGFSGVRFRPCSFEPTFQKYRGERCGGVQVHVTDVDAFLPVDVAVAVLQVAKRLAPDRFDWREPPYEYEDRLMPVDILWGNDRLRLAIDGGASPQEITAGLAEGCTAFRAECESCLLYS